MKQDHRANLIQLLTAPQAADRLGVTIAALERLVEEGRLRAVRLPVREGTRFWRVDVESCAAGVTERAAPLERTGEPASEPVGARPTIVRRPKPSPQPRRPKLEPVASAPFDVWRPEAPSSYLAFRDAEHVKRYLEARATIRG